MELRQHILELLRDGEAHMPRVLQQTHALVGDIEEDDGRAEDAAVADQLRVHYMADTHHDKNKQFLKYALEAHVA